MATSLFWVALVVVVGLLVASKVINLGAWSYKNKKRNTRYTHMYKYKERR